MSLSRRSGWIPSAFQSPDDVQNPALARRPVVMDLIGPDMRTSLLGPDLKLVLHVNPQSIQVTRPRLLSMANAERGRVRWHFGQGILTVSLQGATGGFVRMYSGLTGLASVAKNQPSRRETIAYERYRDWLALFRNNGQVYSQGGAPIRSGQVWILYDGVSYQGWFSSFTSTEEAGRPFQFTLSAEFQAVRETRIIKEPARFRSTPNMVPTPTG